jgi:hypothetical protein
MKCMNAASLDAGSPLTDVTGTASMAVASQRC